MDALSQKSWREGNNSAVERPGWHRTHRLLLVTYPSLLVVKVGDAASSKRTSALFSLSGSISSAAQVF
jgi:hypothetical protein